MIICYIVVAVLALTFAGLYFIPNYIEKKSNRVASEIRTKYKDEWLKTNYSDAFDDWLRKTYPKESKRYEKCYYYTGSSFCDTLQDLTRVFAIILLISSVIINVILVIVNHDQYVTLKKQNEANYSWFTECNNKEILTNRALQDVWYHKLEFIDDWNELELKEE